MILFSLVLVRFSTTVFCVIFYLCWFWQGSLLQQCFVWSFSYVGYGKVLHYNVLYDLFLMYRFWQGSPLQCFVWSFSYIGFGKVLHYKVLYDLFLMLVLARFSTSMFCMILFSLVLVRFSITMFCMIFFLCWFWQGSLKQSFECSFSFFKKL